MTDNNQHNVPNTAVCEVHIEQLDQGIGNLVGIERAFVVFRMRGSVVGQAWLHVANGSISAAALRAHLPSMAWTIWQLQMAEPPNSITPPLSASVVVCTRDRTEDLVGCLPGLQRIAAQGHEVIVVDSCPSDDRTARLVADYPTIGYIHEPRPGLDIARNRGLLAAGGDIVAFTDDDAQVDDGWLDALLRNFHDPIVALVTGITMPLELATPAQQWFESTNGFGRGFLRKHFDLSNIDPVAAGQVGAGVNMAIRKSALEDIGLFDEALDGGTISRSGGDQEFFYRVLARGYRAVYEPAALVWHRHRREWSALRNALHGYGVGVFAWWTRALLVERDFSLLRSGPRWFLHHHVRQLLRALFRRPGAMPRDLIWAEFRGALSGPRAYLRAREVARQQNLRLQEQPIPVSEAEHPPARSIEPASSTTINHTLEIL